MWGFLKSFARDSFNDGLARCNSLGKQMIECKDIGAMLDLGCGSGELTMEFAAACRARSVYGIDFVDEFIARAREKGIRCVKNDLNSTWGLQSGSFDLVLSSQNIEHLHNTRAYLQEAFRCLKKGGQIIILTENLASLVNIGALLFGWQPFSGTCMNGLSLGNPWIWHRDEQKDTRFLEKWHETGVSGTVGHVRVLAFRGLLEILKECGFTSVRVLSTGYLPFRGWLSALLYRLDRRHGHFLVASAFKP